MLLDHAAECVGALLLLVCYTTAHSSLQKTVGLVLVGYAFQRSAGDILNCLIGGLLKIGC